MGNDQKVQTKNLNARHTAWFQLVSATGAFLDRYKGKVSDETLDDIQTLHDCVERVMELEGLKPVSDSSFE